MRNKLADLAASERPKHAGLAYDVWAPIDCHGEFKVPDRKRQDWLKSIGELHEPKGYSDAFDRWRNSFAGDGVTCTATVVATSRLLLGHGNASPTEVGLTLSHTWGMPILPGSSLKGVLAHFVEARYGTDPAYHGVEWDGSRIAKGPGAIYRDLFGAPDAEDDSKALQGSVIFHDAWAVPKGTAERVPVKPDVLTVHQKTYYNEHGGEWPNDYDSPNPVSFLTIAPDTAFLLALSGPSGWAEPALDLLVEALKEWGLGGKTSAGYGRFTKIKEPGREVAEFDEWMKADGAGLSAERQKDAVDERLANLYTLDREQRDLLWGIIDRDVKNNKRTKEWLTATQQALESGVAPAVAGGGGTPPDIVNDLTQEWNSLGGTDSDKLDTVMYGDLLERLEACGDEDRRAVIELLQQRFSAEALQDALAELINAINALPS